MDIYSPTAESKDNFIEVKKHIALFINFVTEGKLDHIIRKH